MKSNFFIVEETENTYAIIGGEHFSVLDSYLTQDEAKIKLGLLRKEAAQKEAAEQKRKDFQQRISDKMKGLVIRATILPTQNNRWAVYIPTDKQVTSQHFSFEEALEIAYQINTTNTEQSQLEDQQREESIFYMYGRHITQEECDELEMGDDYDFLYGTNTVEENQSFASIKEVENEINEQKVDLLTGDHPDGYLIARPGYLVCQEGIFKWNSSLEEYLLVGKIKGNGEITIQHKQIVANEQRAVVIEPFELYFPNHDEDANDDVAICKFNEGEKYKIVDTIVHNVGTTQVLQYVILLEHFDGIGIVIPASKVRIEQEALIY